MQKATSPKRNSFSVYAIVSAGLLITGAITAVLAGVAPANAASLASMPDAQIAAFMVPLTLLVLALMVEVARFALRDTLPEQNQARPPVRRYSWSPGHNEG